MCQVREIIIQWNLSNPDTNGAEESFIFSEVSSFQRLKCMQDAMYCGHELPPLVSMPMIVCCHGDDTMCVCL